MSGAFPQPLGGPAPREVVLSRSPLVRMIAQVRFSSVLRIGKVEEMVSFQEAMRFDFPLLAQATAPQIQMIGGFPGVNFQPVATTVWRFSDASQSWVLSLTNDAVTLETTRYAGRLDFLDRWVNILDKVQTEFAPQLALRVGLRYLNRVHGDDFVHVADFVQPTLVGVAESGIRHHVRQAMSEANIDIEEGTLLLRWGIMPSNATFDPSALEPLPVPSWFLDIDVFSEKQRKFDGSKLSGDFRALAERAYSTFRYVINDSGLRNFGGAV